MARSRQEQREILLKMTQEQLDAINVVKCPRCGGSGHYSYCTLYGTVCFKCDGIGFIRNRKKEKKQ